MMIKLLPLLFLLIGARVHASVLEVDSDAVYKTISDAVQAANSGDQIHVRSGIYREQITLNKSLVLKGEPGAVIEGMGKGSVIVVKQGPSEIRGFTVRGSGGSLVSEDSGIKIQKARNCVVENNLIEDVLFGIFVLSARGARIHGNHVIGKELIPPRRGDGIRIYDSPQTTIEQNIVERSRDLAIWQSNHVTVRKNIVRTSRYGLHYMYCDDSLFEDNTFEDNQVGSAIMYSRRMTLRGNRFTGSRGVGGVGFFIKVGDDILAENNRISDNARGIFLEEVPQAVNGTCIIRNNLVAGNDVGISLQPSIERAVFIENAFVANRVQVEIMGGVIKPKIFSLGEKGNYWSDYVGFDENGDGLGDTPYQIEQFFESLAVRWPELGLLRMGPASEALEMAARTFPLGRPRTVAIDKRPLLRPSEISGIAAVNSASAGLWFPGLLLTACCWITINKIRSAAE
ncbi:nitrous oxide reductase family maturation protein NosD [bacterium]|nr:nitrous oxide reductase family maturation protein NosD [bacterium]